MTSCKTVTPSTLCICDDDNIYKEPNISNTDPVTLTNIWSCAYLFGNVYHLLTVGKWSAN